MALISGPGNRALFGQTPTATLTGLVQDQSGALVTGASLTRTSHQVWTMLEGRGFTGCGKTRPSCHPEQQRRICI
jgi:hypothetical protein